MNLNAPQDSLRILPRGRQPGPVLAELHAVSGPALQSTAQADTNLATGVDDHLCHRPLRLTPLWQIIGDQGGHWFWFMNICEIVELRSLK